MLFKAYCIYQGFQMTAACQGRLITQDTSFFAPRAKLQIGCQKGSGFWSSKSSKICKCWKHTNIFWKNKQMHVHENWWCYFSVLDYGIFVFGFMSLFGKSAYGAFVFWFPLLCGLAYGSFVFLFPLLCDLAYGAFVFWFHFGVWWFSLWGFCFLFQLTA